VFSEWARSSVDMGVTCPKDLITQDENSGIGHRLAPEVFRLALLVMLTAMEVILLAGAL